MSLYDSRIFREFDPETIRKLSSGSRVLNASLDERSSSTNKHNGC